MKYLYRTDDGTLYQKEFAKEDDIPQEDLQRVDEGDLDIISMNDGMFFRALIDSVEEDGEDDTGDDLTEPEATVEYSICEWEQIRLAE